MKSKLLILHGALGSKTQFEPIVGLLESDYEVHAMNFSGHGGNPIKQNFSIDLFVKDLEQFVIEKSLEGTNVFGYSMGGYVALKLALKMPTLIGKIFTLGTKFHWTSETAAHEVKLLNPEKIQEKVPAFAQALKERHTPEDWKQVMNHTAQMMMDLCNGKAMDEGHFTEINHEVIIGIGDQDNMVSMEESKKVASLLPHAKLKVFEGFKHPIEQVDLKELARYLKANIV